MDPLLLYLHMVNTVTMKPVKAEETVLLFSHRDICLRTLWFAATSAQTEIINRPFLNNWILTQHAGCSVRVPLAEVLVFVVVGWIRFSLMETKTTNTIISQCAIWTKIGKFLPVRSLKSCKSNLSKPVHFRDNLFSNFLKSQQQKRDKR